MDHIFSHIADQIALSGPCGTPLIPAVASVISNPRPGLIDYLRQWFERQTELFSVTPSKTDVHITAHKTLRRRALGFAPIEYPPLPQPAWVLLEAIGRAGPSGVLQSSLGPLIGLPASMVHHYIGLLSARRLIGRRKAVFHRPTNDDTPASVTFTSVIVLARYAAQMLEPSSSVDTASDVRLQRLLHALRQPPYIRAERDLKIIAIPDSDRPEEVSRELFQRRRHRLYRSLRTKLLKLGVAALTKRNCVTQSGRVLGPHPCLKLLEREKKDFDTIERERKVSHPLLAGGGDRFVAEIDIVEQVYRMLVEAGASGISVPELHQYLDSKDLTSAPSKRIRTIINTISKVRPTVERQYFEGSAMYLRISLHGDNEAHVKRRKVGMTSLGERRQEIVMELLQEREVLILETLGREVARVENGPLVKVDPKVMRRIISDLVAQKRVKLITTARPTIKDNPRLQNLVLVALPDVDERGEAVRNVVTTVVNRSLYGSYDDARDSPVKRGRDHTMKATGKIRKRIGLGEEDDESMEDIPNGRKGSKQDGQYEEEDSDKEPVIMYEANDSDGSGLDKQESVDEKDNEDEDYEPKIGEKSSTTSQRTASSKIPQRRSARNKGRRSKQSAKTGKKKESSKEVHAKETSTKEVKKRPSRKRKTAEKEGTRPTKRSKSEKQGGEQAEEAAKQSDTPDEGQDLMEGDDAAILIKTQARNLKGSRIVRLRAVDYGCLKGKLARVRRFHKNLYEIMRARNGDDTEAIPAVQHVTVEVARETAVIGRFSFLSVLKEMTVGEYAASVGIYMDHGDTIKKIEREKIVHVLNVMNDEITGNIASRQVQQFVQTMTKLELIQSDVDSQWLLTGAGVIRDFGRGLPSGVVPHGIVFSSLKAVEEYWLELEQFSRCRMSRRPITIDLRNEENMNHVETHPIGDLYFPKRWIAGVHRLQKQEQLRYETILQRLSGVKILLEKKSRLRTDNFIKGKLKRFDIEELDKEMERVWKETQKEAGKPQQPKRGISAEQLLLYSRFRCANPIPKWFLNNLEASQQSTALDPDRKNEVAEDNSCLLQLTRTPSSIKGQQVRAAMPSVFDANHRRYFKTRAKSKPTKELPPEGRADLNRLMPLIRAILRSRAVAYHRNDAEGLDWKVIRSLARFELQESASDLEEAVERENLRRAIVALCEITTVRAAFDILSLKIVLRLDDLSRRKSVNENREQWSAADIAKTAVDLVNNWDSLDTVCSAIVMEVRDDVRHHAQVYIHIDKNPNLDNGHHRSIIRKEFYMDGFLHGRPQSFAHTIEMMASRFRKVADIRLFRNARYAVLLSQPYGELTGNEGVQEDFATIQSRRNDEADGMASNKGSCERIAAPTTDLPARVMSTPQDVPDMSDQGHDQSMSLSQAAKDSAFEAEQSDDEGTMENPTIPDERAAIARPQAEPCQMQDMEDFGPTVEDKGNCDHVAFPEEKAAIARPQAESLKVQDLDGVRSAVEDKMITEETVILEERAAIARPQVGPPMVPVTEGDQASTGKCSSAAGYGDQFSANGRDDASHCPPELAELVVCTVVRQPPHAQWKRECLKLLSQFREEDLADARDRLILRGSVSVHAEREQTYCCIQPCKNSAPVKTMATLRGDMGDRDKWEQELRQAEGGCLENTSLWHDLCSVELPSSFATAFSASSAFFDSSGLSLVPEFEEDDEATHEGHDDDEDEDDDDEFVTRVKLYYQYEKEGESRGHQKTTSNSGKGKKNCVETQKGEFAIQNVSESIKVTRQRVGHEIAKSGRDGISLDRLMERLNPHREDEKEAIAGALQALLQDGGIRRFAVESNDEEWKMTTGILYICAIHCSGETRITAWRTPNGEIDEQLVEWIHAEIYECILHAPGCKAEDVIDSVCAKHTSLPRRAVADIIFCLEGEVLNSSIIMLQSGWRMLRRRASFVDENGIVTWGRACVQSLSGDAAKFHRIETSQWRESLSNFCNLL